MAASFRVDPNQADFANREEEIRALKANPATRRAMALGDRYAQLQIPIDQLAAVEEDFRKARLFEVVTISKAMREVELDEQRRLVIERQKEEANLKQLWLSDYHRMRQKAYDVLLHEADTVRAEEARRLEADKRAILQIERSRLLERRQAFEAGTVAGRLAGGGGIIQQYGGTPTRTGRSMTPGGGGSLALPPNPNGAPLLVMNVTLGNGREEKLTVRVNDDPKRIAVMFARRHQLPDSAAVNLTNQIRAHLSSRTGGGGSGSVVPASVHLGGGGGGGNGLMGTPPPDRSLYAGMNQTNNNL